MTREERVRSAFRAQGEACDALGSPFTARLCRLAAERLDPGLAIARRVLDWEGDPGSTSGDALPLRLAASLHARVLTGEAPDLARVYPPNDVEDETLWQAVEAALAAHAPAIDRQLDSPPQTNEPQRSAALCPAFLAVAAATGLPLVCSEIGASAGLNLLWHRFAYRFGAAVRGDAGSPLTIAPEWHGPPPPPGPIDLAEAAGCDLRPVDPRSPAARTRLLSYVWPDQRERLARVRAALDLARETPPRVDAADAADWLAARLAEAERGRAHVVFHSIVWQYLPRPTQNRLEAALRDSGGRADAGAPLAWLRLEPDGRSPGAALTLTLWPGGITHDLGRADFHGKWVRWNGVMPVL